MFSSKNKRRYSKINYKKQIPLFKCGYMINENEAEIEKVRSHRYDINRPRPGHGHKHNKYKMCLNIMMSNI